MNDRAETAAAVQGAQHVQLRVEAQSRRMVVYQVKLDLPLKRVLAGWLCAP